MSGTGLATQLPQGQPRRAALRSIAGAALTWLMPLHARGATAQAGAAAPAGPRSLDEWRRLLAPPQALEAARAERDALLTHGEALLAQGDAAGAHDQFQRAASMAHAAEIECSIVRAQMQAGDYRRALAFGAHAALAHRDRPAAACLYAWLLHAGGQGVQAQRLLDEALAQRPGDAWLAGARAALAVPWPRPLPALLAAPWRHAPYAHGTDGASTAPLRLAGTALLDEGGRSAIVPAASIDGRAAPRARCWVRNGLGRTVRANVQAPPAGAPVAWRRLQLEEALPWPEDLRFAERAPFAGSPLSVLSYAPQTDTADPAWPLLRQGFFGRPDASGALARLDVDLPPGAGGSAVFERKGRLAGLVVDAGDGVPRILPASSWCGAKPAEPTSAASPPAAAPTPDALYELGLRIALQLLIEGPV